MTHSVVTREALLTVVQVTPVQLELHGLPAAQLDRA